MTKHLNYDFSRIRNSWSSWRVSGNIRMLLWGAPYFIKLLDERRWSNDSWLQKISVIIFSYHIAVPNFLFYFFVKFLYAFFLNEICFSWDLFLWVFLCEVFLCEKIFVNKLWKKSVKINKISNAMHVNKYCCFN